VGFERCIENRQSALPHLVEALRYTPEGRGFDSRLCYGEYFLHNPSDCTIALESSQPLTETFPGIKGDHYAGLTILPP